MAKIYLNIEADNTEEYLQTLMGLVRLATPAVATVHVQPASESTMQEPKAEAPKRAPKKTAATEKAQAAATADHGRPAGGVAELTDEEDDLDDAGGKAEPGSYTLADVQAQLHSFVAKHSMPKAREVMEQFLDADGAPVKRLTGLQEADYAAAFAALAV